MKSLQRKPQVCTCFMMIVLNTLVLIQAATAQLSLSPVTGVLCYGNAVTLVCTHPVLPQEPEYLQADVTWMRDGTAMSTVGLGRTKPNSTTTRLQFTINEDSTGNYTCFLFNKVQGGIVESNSVSVRPRDLTPPHIANMDPLESSITVRWTPQPCAVKYNVSWMYTNDDGTTTTGSGVSDQVTNYTIPTSVQGVYTVSVQAVDEVGNVGPATSEVVRSTYPRPTADAPPCEDRSLVLTCLVSGLHNDRRSHFRWIDRNRNLTNSTLYTITGPQLMIANVSALSDEENKGIQCCEVLSNGMIVEGVEYKVEPLAQPGPPEVTITTTDSTITLTWNTALRCFESEMFTFVVIWNEIGSGTSTNVTTSSSPYTISGLQPGTFYQISVHGVGGSGVVGGIRVRNVTTALGSDPMDPPPPPSATSLVVWLPIVIILGAIISIIVVIAIIVLLWLKRKHNHGLQKAKVALLKISCYRKEGRTIDDNEDLNYSSSIPVQATNSPTTGQSSDPMRSADSNVHLPGNSHQFVSKVPSPLPQEVQETVCVGYSCTSIPGYNSFGMDSNNTTDCVSIGQSHNWAKGSDFVLSPVNECSTTAFVAQFLNCLLPNFNMSDTLEYTWNI